MASLVLAAADENLKVLQRNLDEHERLGQLASATRDVREITRVHALRLMAEKVFKRKDESDVEGEGLRILTLAAGEKMPPLRKNMKCLTVVFQEESESEKAERLRVESAVQVEARRHEVHRTPAPPAAEKQDPPALTGEQIFWKAMNQSLIDQEHEEDGD